MSPEHPVGGAEYPVCVRRVDLQLPMSLSSESFGDEPRMQSFLNGPVVLAGDPVRRDLLLTT
jgi:hypothetical protein